MRKANHVPDNIINLAQARLHNTLTPVFEGAEVVATDLRAVLEKHGFAASYVEAVVDELVEGWLNGDTQPVWHHPNYNRR